MIFIENNNLDPYKNLALEQLLLDQTDDDCFMLWRNETSVIIGKNQNTFLEVNLPYVKEQNIHLVRRGTGGGAIYADEGNLMYTFISAGDKGAKESFRRFSAPIVNALNDLGIPAEFAGRNDLLIDGKKCSGNSQRRYRNKILHHGTLMYHVDTSALRKALKVREIKFTGKAVRSMQSRVTNIRDHMSEQWPLAQFQAYLFQNVMEQMPGARRFSPDAALWAQAEQLAQETFRAQSWIYGRNPASPIHKEGKFPGGLVEAYLDVKDGVIEQIYLFGDFFGSRDIGEIEARLIGTLCRRDAIQARLHDMPLSEYFHNIDLEDIVSLLAD